MRRPVLQVVNSSAIAWILAGGLATVWAGVVNVPFTVAFPTAAMIVGGLWLLGGGSVLSRATTIDAMSWGIRLDQRHLTEEATQGGLGELTPFGLSLIVGLELIIVGTLLSP